MNILCVIFSLFIAIAYIPSAITTDDNNDDYDVRFIFAIGSEGTGHHSAEQAINSSPIQSVLNDRDLVKAQGEICNLLWQFLLNRCDVMGHAPNEDIYRLLVHKFKILDHALRANKSHFYGEGTSAKGGTMNIHINLLYGCTVSYPSFEKKQCRDQQYLSLHVFYKACAEARVNCGHVVMIRDAYDVWSSTALRHFDDPKRLAHTLATKLDSIASQMLSFGHGLVACVDYDHPKRFATNFTTNLFGWNNVPNGDLDRVIDKYYNKAHHHHTDKEMAKFDPEKNNLYIESMGVTTKLIRDLCEKQLRMKIKNPEVP